MLLQRAFTLGTPRRVSASSITSSWYSEPRCTSSHGDGAGDRVGGCRRRSAPSVLAYAAQSVSVGRRRLPPAPMRWVATSARNGSGVLTESRSAGVDPRRGRRGATAGRQPAPRVAGGRSGSPGPGMRPRYAASGTFSKPAGRFTLTGSATACRSSCRCAGGTPSGADYTENTSDPPREDGRATRGGFQPCSNASPIEPAEWSSWRRRKRACSTTTTSGPSTSCSA